MYQIYNFRTESYGVIFHKLNEAKSFANQFSKMFRSVYAVVDMNTGEVLAEFGGC